MKQILQSARTGKLELAEVPAPSLEAGQVLVRTHFSVVSPGTEKLALDFARTSLVGKARKRPDLVQQVTRKLRQEGPVATYRAVMGRLDAPQALGYSCAGVVEAVGAGVTRIAPGDRVACAGAGYANHAELNVIPENLVCRVPDAVPLDRAAYATVGAIAMQGLRLAQPALGEIAVVVGLGLIGQLAVQLLKANGCRVLGIDLDAGRIKQAIEQGAEWGLPPTANFDEWKLGATGGHGADLALITASANDAGPIALAADLARQKGRLSVVGAMPMDLDRRAFYDKELELRVSMSYGPGRYDRNYEESGLDYPLPYVRWTENRNLQSFLDLVAASSVKPEALETEIVPFDDAETAYAELAEGKRRSLSIVFRYDVESPVQAQTLHRETKRRAKRSAEIGIALIGAGNYTKSVLLPALDKQRDTRRIAVVTATGASAQHTAERFDFATASTDPQAALDAEDVDLVFVTTRHDSHADLAARALRAGKAVWLEKPAALDEAGLGTLLEAAQESEAFLTVGYNRRFSSHARAIRAHLGERDTPLALHYVIAAGAPPAGTWIMDPAVGGGRIVGEVCHFVDLCTYLTGSLPRRVYARALSRDPEQDDSTVIQLEHADGSIASIEYLARAHGSLPKERFEVSGAGHTASCTNFRASEQLGGKTHKTVNQDKGQAAAIEATVAALRQGDASPISLAEIAAVSAATFAVRRSLESGNAEEVVTWGS